VCVHVCGLKTGRDKERERERERKSEKEYVYVFVKMCSVLWHVDFKCVCEREGERERESS